jgi:protein-S-isoprenylcysteine O-methyltransferase Ste14
MNIGNFFFKYRSYTPIPLAALILYNAQLANSYISLGLACIIFGESIRFWAVSYAGSITRTTKVSASTLCTAGPFANTRNPLYIGNMLMYTGIVLIAGASNILAILMLTWLFFIIQYYLIINLEEQTLTRIFGATYLDYSKNVPRIFPRLISWESNDNREPMTLLETMRTEKRTLQNIIIFIIFIYIRYRLLEQ